MRIAITLAALGLLFVQAAFSQETRPIGLDLSGIGKPIVTLTAQSFSGLPVVEQDVSFQTSKGQEHGRYKGVLLWDVLATNGLGSLLGHNEALRHTVVVAGADGYEIAFSAGEIMPDFGNTAMMIATEVDGKPYAGEGMRLVVPGDKRGARSVKDVIMIEVR